MSELKTCVFCGSKNIKNIAHSNEITVYRCLNCGEIMTS